MSTRHEDDGEYLDFAAAYAEPAPHPATRLIEEPARSIIASNNSPDVPFDHSINPYRGCEHGCAYCYARPTHEYGGDGAGLDFETKIYVKTNAPELLAKELARKSWRPAVINISGVTDCYQPAERRYRLTRRCLEVLLAHRSPCTIVTKNALVVRDLDVLRELASRNLVRVFLSVTTLDDALWARLEPRSSPPRARLGAIAKLAAAGVPVGTLIAPIIPGLTDREIPMLLGAAKAAGAQSAGFTVLRLPLGVRDVFAQWLETHRPDAASHVLGRVADIRGGGLNDARFSFRMSGEGPYAEQIASLFAVFARRHGLDRRLPPLSLEAFAVPPPVVPTQQGGMRCMFDEGGEPTTAKAPEL